VSRHDREWLDDIVDAIQAIRDYQERGDLNDGMTFDAVRLRLIEIGQAAKRLSPALLASEPELPWEEIAGMRDRLAHRYFDTSHAIVQATMDNDIPELGLAVQRLLPQAS